MMRRREHGQTLVELLLAIAMMAILLPALFTGLFASRQGKAQQNLQLQAAGLMREEQEAVRIIREKGWANIKANGTYHAYIAGSSWALASGAETVNGFTRQVVMSDVYRDVAGNIVSSGGSIDPSTKKLLYTVSWTSPLPSSITATSYLTRYMANLSYTQTTVADFNTGTLTQAQITNTAGGEVTISNNTKGKWCSPTLSSSTISLPDGPPVAVAATASATVTVPNDVFVATSPNDTNSIKLAYVTVPANVDPPSPSLHGIFTLDSTKYSSPSLVPTSIGVSNSFKTIDVKYYKSSGGNLYAILATDLPNKEVIVILIKNAIGVDQYQDPTNKIYKYWTFFNTRQYQGDGRSTPNQDQSPFGYGAETLTVNGNRGYVESGGFLYIFDLSNIDAKSPSNGLDMVGCRIELDGYDCQPNNGTDKKYNAGQTGTTWSNTTSPAHLSCSDGGNIELFADHQLSVYQANGSTYVNVAVGAGTDPELDTVNVSSVPSTSTSPSISSNSCGTIASGNNGWKRVGTLDFDPYPGTEEAANSVYTRSDGKRAYMSSNGGIIHNGIPDSDQFYILDTSTPSTPNFLTTWPSTQFTPSPGHYGGTASSGYYNGSGSNLYLYPRRSITVFNDQRAILVGQDGNASDNNQAQQYQVLNISAESAPTYCGGLNYTPGFNDLATVSEADGDNFVYLVANDTSNSLKIIQGGPDGTYLSSGTYESAIFDVGYSTVFNRYAATISLPTNTTLRFQFAVADPANGICSTATYNYVGPDGTADSYYSGSSGQLYLSNGGGSYQNPGRCMRYKAYFVTTDYNAAPILYDMNVNYSP